MKNKYYSLVKAENEATINIYGDITSWPWEEFGEVSANDLSKQLEVLQDVAKINVHISSYGGEVKEGLAIYNALRAHKAKIVTYCDSFACSIASVIFMAGDERIMNAASLLMIHNAWTFAEGNSKELRKVADDLEVITSASVEAYKERATISEKEIRKMMDNETWISPEKAVEYGFATSINKEKTENASQSAKRMLCDIVLKAQDEAEGEKEKDDEELGEDEEKPEKDDPSDPEDDPEDEGDEKDPEKDEEKPEDEEKTKASEATQKMIGFFSAIF